MVLRLAEAGAGVFRLNFSHGTQSDHLNDAVFVRAAEQTVGRPLGLLADLQGPNLRIGRFEAGRVSLRPGQRFRLDLDRAAGTRRGFAFPTLRSSRHCGQEIICCSMTVESACERSPSRSFA